MLNRAARPPIQQHTQTTRSLTPKVLSGTSEPFQQGHTWSSSHTAPLGPLLPHLRKHLKTTVLPLSPWKGKSTPKGKKTTTTTKHLALFRDDLALLFSQHRNVLTVSN